MADNREPQLNIRLNAAGDLIAETYGANGMRKKLEINNLADITAELLAQRDEQNQRQRAQATARHTSVFSYVATTHDLPLACRTVGGPIPQAARGESYFFSAEGKAAAKAAAEKQATASAPRNGGKRKSPSISTAHMGY